MDRRILATLFAVALLALVPAAASAGPIVLMGIDAEDGGPGGHGPVANYNQIANDVKSNVTNGGSGILVIGGGKDTAGPDQVTEFWNAVGAASSQSVTYVNGASDIGSRSFAGFGTIAVTSSESGTDDGLTQAENDALTGRRSDISKFVNEGGGLIGFSQTGFTDASRYGYISEFGSFDFRTSLSYSDIDPTPDGEAIGVTNAFDICCWHDTYTKFPSFLKVLAFDNEGSGQASAAQAAPREAAALGGKTVFIDDKPPASTAEVPACSPDGRIKIAVSDESGGSGPKAARFKIDGGAEQSENTDSGGVAVVTVPNGTHSLEYWGEDKAGNQEPGHHTARVVVDTTRRCAAPAAQAGISSTIARLSGGCVRGSSVLVRMRVRTSGTLRYARVAVDGKRVRSTKKKAFSVRIKLRGMKVGRHRVVLTAQNTDGRSTVSSRSFARCAQVSPRFTG